MSVNQNSGIGRDMFDFYSCRIVLASANMMAAFYCFLFVHKHLHMFSITN